MAKFLIKAGLALAGAIALQACASSRSLDASISDLSGDVELKSILFTDRSHDYSDVDITLFEGRLLLTGTVHHEAGRDKLIENAWKADGVRQVIDEIFVGDGTPLAQGLTDTRIKQTLRTKLIGADDVESTRYKIAVSSGVVYLIGAAYNQSELDRTLDIARRIGGVTKVVSYATLRQPGDAQ